MELGTQLASARTQQEQFFASKRKDDGSLDMSAEEVAAAHRRNDDITRLAKSYEEATEIELMASTNADALAKGSMGQRLTQPVIDAEAREAAKQNVKTLGEMFVESEAFTGWKPGMKEGPQWTLNLEAAYGKAVAAQGIAGVQAKTLFDTGGYAIQNIRLPDPLTPGYETVSVASLMNEGRTSGSAILYMEETTTTNAAAETAESGTKPESALAFTERTSTVRKIATSLPVTDEALEDIPFIESYINTRLRQFVILRENQQLLTGDGSAPNLRGILNTSGIQTQAKGADPTPDAIYKAATLIRVNAFVEPTGVVLHPNDWQDIRLLRTTDGIYIWGSPSDVGPERIWGMQVLQTTQETENTSLVGAFRAGAEVFRRADLTMQVGYVNDQFVKNQRTILAEERLALVVFRPAAFCTVTGI